MAGKARSGSANLDPLVLLEGSAKCRTETIEIRLGIRLVLDVGVTRRELDCLDDLKWLGRRGVRSLRGTLRSVL
jgi:hypothetical protein